jgi:hypothetical protein
MLENILIIMTLNKYSLQLLLFIKIKQFHSIMKLTLIIKT